MSEPVVILKQESWLDGQGRVGRVPVDGIGKIDIKVGDNRLSLQCHVRRGRKVGLLNVLELIDQGILRRATRTRVPFDRSLINHDGKGEPGMGLRLSHDQFCGGIDTVVWAVPIDDDAIDSRLIMSVIC